MSPFCPYNTPCVRKKFITIYMIVMLCATLSSVFGAFYPLMPCLFYIFLAFIILVYKPYLNGLSNYRACYFSLLISFGYLIRVIYLFSFKEDPNTQNGILYEDTWTVCLWIILVLIGLTLVILDIFLMWKKKIVEKKKRQ